MVLAVLHTISKLMLTIIFWLPGSGCGEKMVPNNKTSFKYRQKQRNCSSSVLFFRLWVFALDFCIGEIICKYILEFTNFIDFEDFPPCTSGTFG